MKKTFTINISGTVFHIEEDAYDVLQKYLINLKNHFGNNEEGQEIITDIEARIAEIFSEKSANDKKVITLDFVNDVIKTMGTPEDFAEEEGEDEPISAEAKRKRRLYRDPDRRVLGGVCGGLGAYFNMDLAILRIIFAVLFFATSGGFGLVYIILWIAVPKALSTTQRLEMRGQEATVKNIEKSIKEEVIEVKESYKKFKESDTYSKGKKSVEGAGDVAYSIVKVLLKVFVIIVGVILIILGFFGILSVISSSVIGHSIVQDWPMVWTPEVHFPGFLNHFIEPGTVTFGMIGIAMLVGIPMLAMLYIGTKLVFRFKSNNGAIALAMVGVWLVTLVALLVVSAGQVSNFKSRSSQTSSQSISCDSCQTLYLKMGEDRYDDYAKMDFELEDFRVVMVDGEEVMIGKPELDVVKSGSDDFVITIKSASRGKTREDAKESIKDIIYNYQFQDSIVNFDPYFTLNEDGKWRDQEVYITVKVPEGKAVYLGEDLVKIINDIENVSNTWVGDMVDKIWEMKPEGLMMQGWEEEKAKAEAEEKEETENE